ncbi:MAG: hypothetical protein R3B84_12970 [Zavarzinella sp.]
MRLHPRYNEGTGVGQATAPGSDIFRLKTSASQKEYYQDGIAVNQGE